MTDGRYPDGDPYGHGVADEVYGTGNHAAYPAYDTGANTAYGATAYDSGSWQTGGYQSPDGVGDPGGYPQEFYPAGTGQNGYDPSAYGTSTAYSAVTDGYGDTSGAYTAFSYDGSGAYAAVDTSGGYPAYDSGAYQAYGDGTYGQGVAAVPQTGYEQYDQHEQHAWSGDVLTAVQDQPGVWTPETWTTEEAAVSWYDPATAGQAQAPAVDDYADAPAWETAPPQTFEGVDPFAGTQEFRLDLSSPLASPDTDGTAPTFDQGGSYGADDYANDFADGLADEFTGQSSYSVHTGHHPDSAGDGDTRAAGHPDTTETTEFSVAAVRDALVEESADHRTHDDDASDDYARTPARDDDARVGAASAAAAVGARALSPSAASNRAARRKTTRRTRPMVKVAGGSLGVLGAAAMAVAAAGGIQADTPNRSDDTVASGVDVPLASSPLDQQFTQLQESAEDFADRASRTQARVALEEKQAEIARQQAEQARIQAEQARLAEEERIKAEQMRPKYALPVRPGLSAYFGQAGGRWSSLHTGIDFPVSSGTPVHAVTDGVVRTQWNSAYGNMVILTAPDGTETWYCHLSRAKVVSGPVKAGAVIAYSGNTGNSTGPHLHLEVHPGGGAAVNPVSWLRNKGLDPT